MRPEELAQAAWLTGVIQGLWENLGSEWTEISKTAGFLLLEHSL